MVAMRQGSSCLYDSPVIVGGNIGNCDGERGIMPRVAESALLQVRRLAFRRRESERDFRGTGVRGFEIFGIVHGEELRWGLTG